MNTHPWLHSLYVGKPKQITDSIGTWVSSIHRDRVEGSAQVTPTGLVGDGNALPHHGKPDAAICVYLNSSYRFWKSKYGFDFQPGQFGENFVLEGLDESDLCVGDVVAVGSVKLILTGQRIPCANLSRWLGVADFHQLATRESLTGCYYAVLEPGSVKAGDGWLLLERPNPRGTVPAINRAMFLEFDPVLAEEMLNMPGLVPYWKDKARKKLEEWQANRP